MIALYIFVFLIFCFIIYLLLNRNLLELKTNENVCTITKNPNELHNQYNCIFPNRNRNAASHRWSQHILNHATKLTREEFTEQFQSFCPVSGSPINKGVVFKLSLPTTTGKNITGFVKHCCWPCACDIQDAANNGTLKIHTKEIKLKDGKFHSFDFIVINNPCNNDVKIPKEAPDLNCINKKLEKGYYIDNKVVIGMLHMLRIFKILI